MSKRFDTGEKNAKSKLFVRTLEDVSTEEFRSSWNVMGVKKRYESPNYANVQGVRGNSKLTKGSVTVGKCLSWSFPGLRSLWEYHASRTSFHNNLFAALSVMVMFSKSMF